MSGFKPKWPEEFQGEEHRWYEWSFTVRAYIAASKIFASSVLRDAEKRDIEITIADVDRGARDRATREGTDPDAASQEMTEKNEQLYHLLAMLCRSSALTTVRHVPEGNGLEAWRQMSKK